MSARGRSQALPCTDTAFSAKQSGAARSTVSDAALVYCSVVWLLELQHRNVQKVLYLAHMSDLRLVNLRLACLFFQIFKKNTWKCHSAESFDF